MTDEVITPVSTTDNVAPVDPPVVTEVVVPPVVTEVPPVVPPVDAEYAPFTYTEGTRVDEKAEAMFRISAKEAGLTQAQAQKLTDMGAAWAQKLTDDNTTAQLEMFQGWEKDSRADKEFGGDKLNANLAIASKAIDAFATPELKALLVSSGLGNHPEMIRAFYRAGKAMSEDNLLPGGRTPGSERSLADKLYSKS